MRQRELTQLLKKMEHLTPAQRRQVMAGLSAGEKKDATMEIIERHAPALPQCPHCEAKHTVRNGNAEGLQRYKCRICHRSFNGLTGTPLARLHLRGKWLDQTEAMRDGLSLTQVMARLNIARTTAFRWRHRFMAAPKLLHAQRLAGIAEADETFFLRSGKGQRKGLGRPARQRGGRAKKRGLSAEQVPVLVARDRSGSTADFILAADNASHIRDALQPIIAQDAILCSDSSKAMMAAARLLGVTHRPVNLSAGIRVIAGVYHVQNVNAYASRLKSWLRTFKGVATRYLDSYLGWFRALDRSPNSCLHPASFLALSVTS